MSGLAIGSLVCGILSLVTTVPGCCCLPFFILSGALGLVAVVLGIFGIQQCNQQGHGGKGMAIAGVACGGVALVLTLLLVVLLMTGMLADIIKQANP